MDWLLSLLDHLTYPVICFLMFIESTVIPFPSEVVVPPAAYRAAAGELNIIMVIIVATIGADLGAIANYLAGYYLGRPIIYKFAESRLGHMCLLNREKIQQAETYFNNHGAVATLSGRLIPGIRQLISVPAGLARMNFGKFILYTTIGAGAWNCILAVMGWYLHSIVPADQLANKVNEYSEYIKLVVLAILSAVILFFVVKHYIKKRKE